MEETREIPRESWIDFFDGFSRRHQGWLVDVEVLRGDIGAQFEAEGLPLEGISADKKTKDISIAVMSKDKIVEHFVLKPAHVRVEEVENGAEAAIEIESDEGDITVVTFRSAVPTETVDGLLPEQAKR